MLWILLVFAHTATASVTIAGLFHEDNYQAQIPFSSLIYANKMLNEGLQFRKLILENVSRTDTNEVSQLVCDLVETGNGIAAIFGPNSPRTNHMVQSVTSRLEIPHIQTTCYPTINKVSNQTVINMCPRSDVMSWAISIIIKSLHWRDFIILYEDDDALIRLQDVLKLQEYDENGLENKLKIRKLGPGPDYRSLLKEYRNSTTSQFVIDCKFDNIMAIMEQALEVNLISSLRSFFITHLDAHILDYMKFGEETNITTIRMTDPENPKFIEAVKNWQLTESYGKRPTHLDTSIIKVETALMYDAVRLFIESAKALHVTEALETRPLSCGTEEIWEGGLRIASYMKVKPPKVSLTGPIAFDDHGRRTNFSLQLVEVNRHKVIATWNAETPDIIYHNRSIQEYMKTIEENLQKTTVIVYSRLGPPYLMEKKPSSDGEILEGNNRFEGFSIDYIREIAALRKFKFELRITKDYGSFDSTTKQWNGLIKEILDRNAHLAICDLTITHSRQSAVDFSMPFMTLGISILSKIPEEEYENKLFAFMKPFGVEVWMFTATLYLVISITQNFLARINKGDWENPDPFEEEPPELENKWNYKNSFWLTLGSVLMQAGDIAPWGISTRAIVSMWWFFSLLISNSSYTANLAAFLSKQRSSVSISNVEQLAAQTKVKYGLMKGGATEAFFKESTNPTYQKMWNNMLETKPSVFRKDNAEGVKMVQGSKKGLYAFLMESTQIEYETETKCDLVKVGDWLDTKRYGIAMPMNAPYRDLIDKAILELQESGVTDQLKKKWWKEKRSEPSCPKDSNEPKSDALTLETCGGVFIVALVGIGLSYIVAILEVLWYVRAISIEYHISYWTALKTEVKFALDFRKFKKPTNLHDPESKDESKEESGSENEEIQNRHKSSSK